jgi:hypothetical protein
MNAQQVWQAQAMEAPRISLEYVRHQAGILERKTRRGNVGAYVVCVLACGYWGWNAWQYFADQPIMLASLACYALFAFYCIYRTHRYASAESSPADAGVLDTLRYQRRQFERQRDFARGSWRWWIPAVLPGMALTLASGYFEVNPVPWRLMGIMALVFVAGLGFAAWITTWEARGYQREIDALDSLLNDQ